MARSPGALSEALNLYSYCFSGSPWTERQRRPPWPPRPCGESDPCILPYLTDNKSQEGMLDAKVPIEYVRGTVSLRQKLACRIRGLLCMWNGRKMAA